jgi:hypothetical protein
MLAGTKHIGGAALALQGTLDTFSLPDVLKLLATTSKTGRLRIDGDRGQGSVWLRDGRVVDADADRAVDGAPKDEVVFELLRFGTGSFAFDSDNHTPNAEHPDEVDDLLRRANALLSEWTELEAVVPSLHHRVSLTAELSSDEVTIDADRWRSVVAVAGGRSVGEVASSLGLSELHVSRAVRDLVELGVIDVDSPEPIPEPRPLTELTDLPSERPRRSAGSRSRPTPPRGIPGLPLPGPSGRGSGEHVPSGRGSGERVPGGHESGEHVPSGRGSGERVPSGHESGEQIPEPALAGDSPRAGWRQSDRTSGSPQTVGPDGLPPSARATNGQGRSAGQGSRSRRSDADGPAPPSAAPGPSGSRSSRSSNGGRPASRAGRGRSAGAPPPQEAPSTDPGFSSRFPTDLPAVPTSPPALPGLPDSGPLRDDASPFTGGGLVPPVDSIHTGQIRPVSSSALPPEMHWAADDEEPGGTTGPITSPFAGLSSLGRPHPVPEGELAPHLAAMSPEARAAVQATVGPTGGSAGVRSPNTGDDVAQRGRLINFLSSVR